MPTYAGMMLHAHTRKRELVDMLSHLGMSISYTRVIELSAQMGNSACQQFHREQVVCSPKDTQQCLHNVNHRQYRLQCQFNDSERVLPWYSYLPPPAPSFTGEGVNRSIAIDVPPVTTNMKNISAPATSVDSVVYLTRDNFKEQTEEEYMWLEHARRVIEGNTWSAFNASLQPQLARAISPTAQLPLFLDSAHTVAMIRHSMDVVKNIVEHVNPGQPPVVTLDQPLFALAKQIQWKWPETYGEDKLVVMFGGLHIEMAALKTLGDWLRGSAWVQALVQTEIATPGTADSFLRAAHGTRTRRAHQITAIALHILQHRAYERHPLPESFRLDFEGDVEAEWLSGRVPFRIPHTSGAVDGDSLWRCYRRNKTQSLYNCYFAINRDLFIYLCQRL